MNHVIQVLNDLRVPNSIPQGGSENVDEHVPRQPKPDEAEEVSRRKFSFTTIYKRHFVFLSYFIDRLRMYVIGRFRKMKTQECSGKRKRHTGKKFN